MISEIRATNSRKCAFEARIIGPAQFSGLTQSSFGTRSITTTAYKLKIVQAHHSPIIETILPPCASGALIWLKIRLCSKVVIVRTEIRDTGSPVRLVTWGQTPPQPRAPGSRRLQTGPRTLRHGATCVLIGRSGARVCGSVGDGDARVRRRWAEVYDFEAMPLPLSSPDDQVRVFNPVILAHPPGRWRLIRPKILAAARHDAGLSVVIVSGRMP